MKFPHPQRSTFGVGALVIAGLATTQALQTLLPSDDGTFGTGLQRPFVREGRVGTPIELRSGTLTVTGIEGGTVLQGSYEPPVSTTGVFVVVRFDWVARDAASGMSKVVVTDTKGRTFIADGLGSSTNKISCPASTPGVTRECVVTVEMPRDALPGATMSISQNLFDEGYDDVAAVPLGIDERQAATFGAGRTVSLTTGYKGLT